MNLFAGWPWWATLIGLVIVVLLAVYVFQNIILPLIGSIT